MWTRSDTTSDVVLSPTRRRPSALQRLRIALATWRQRQTLARLDDHLLRDLGLSRRDVESEVHRPIWDVPDFWRR